MPGADTLPGIHALIGRFFRMNKNVLPQIFVVVLVLAASIGWCAYKYYTEYDEVHEITTRHNKEKNTIETVRKVIKNRKFPVNMGLDLKGGVHVVLECNPKKKTKPKPEEISGVIEVMQKRINPKGVREISIQKQGDRWINIDIPGERDPDRVRRLIGKTAKLEYLYTGGMEMEDDEAVPEEWRNRMCDEHERARIVANKGGCVVISGKHMKKATADFDEFGKPAVAFELKKEASDRFFKFTRNHVTKETQKHYMPIALDGVIISSPVIKGGIPGGRGQISGSFTAQEVKDLVTALNSGALPIEVAIAEMRAVSPTLGKTSVEKSLYAGLAGFCLVIIFMIAFYRLPGAMAGLALLFYVTIVLGAMSMLNAVLTLPGIAGFVLSIGMAVDANVIIFERLKEELRLGKTMGAALDAGFARAFTAILDSNVTTLIATAVLYSFGSGLIRGFAVTLSLGILASMFSAVMITRVLLILITKVPSMQNLSLYGVKPRPAEGA